MSKRRIIIIWLAISLLIVVFLIWYLLVIQKEGSDEIIDNKIIDENSETSATVLSAEEFQAMLEATTPAPGAEPALNEEEMQMLIESTAPTPGEEPVLSAEEFQALIDATTPQTE